MGSGRPSIRLATKSVFSQARDCQRAASALPGSDSDAKVERGCEHDDCGLAVLN